MLVRLDLFVHIFQLFLEDLASWAEGDELRRLLFRAELFSLLCQGLVDFNYLDLEAPVTLFQLRYVLASELLNHLPYVLAHAILLLNSRSLRQWCLEKFVISVKRAPVQGAAHYCNKPNYRFLKVASPNLESRHRTSESYCHPFFLASLRNIQFRLDNKL